MRRIGTHPSLTNFQTSCHINLKAAIFSILQEPAILVTDEIKRFCKTLVLTFRPNRNVIPSV